MDGHYKSPIIKGMNALIFQAAKLISSNVITGFAYRIITFVTIIPIALTARMKLTVSYLPLGCFPLLLAHC